MTEMPFFKVHLQFEGKKQNKTKHDTHLSVSNKQKRMWLSEKKWNASETVGYFANHDQKHPVGHALNKQSKCPSSHPAFHLWPGASIHRDKLRQKLFLNWD